jgi:hypothetical protein
MTDNIQTRIREYLCGENDEDHRKLLRDTVAVIECLEKNPLYAVNLSPTANRFMVFAGDCFEPKGGADGLEGRFDRLDQALMNVGAFLQERPNIDAWWHIYDCALGKKVGEGLRDSASIQITSP